MKQQFILLRSVVLLLALLPSVGVVGQDIALLPLAEHGPYAIGQSNVRVKDASRNNRGFNVNIWYPAELSAGADPSIVVRKADPDRSAAPYPLILYSPAHGQTAREQQFYVNHLASQGFVVAAVNHPSDLSPKNWLDRPLDVQITLDYLTALIDDPLVGMMDTNNVGVTGMSFGGYTAFAMGGAQIEAGSFVELCPEKIRGYLDGLPDATKGIEKCDLILDYANQLGLVTDDLWKPFSTDERIHALLAMAPYDLSDIYGGSGLAPVAAPTFILTGSLDSMFTGQEFAYQHLGSAARYFMSVNDAGHVFAFDSEVTPEQAAYIKHFATAFFGFYLQGNADDANYLTREFAGQFANIEWQSTMEQ